MTKIKFVYPRKTLPLSLTGKACALNCAHCNGHFLKHMKSFSDYDEEGFSKKVSSYLVSGGCNSSGAVPLKENLEVLRTLSRNHKVLAHTGLIKEEDVAVVSRFLYAASFNLIGDDSTIKEVYNLDKTVNDFMDSYNALSKEVSTFPHITIGLHRGVVKGEYHALDMLSKLGAKAVVLNVFIPALDTEFEGCKPPDLGAVQDVISHAKQVMDKTQLFLGCMRPGGFYRDKLDAFCVEAGMDRIVAPSRSAREVAKSMNYEITESKECCII